MNTGYIPILTYPPFLKMLLHLFNYRQPFLLTQSRRDSVFQRDTQSLERGETASLIFYVFTTSFPSLVLFRLYSLLIAFSCFF